ncbi:MAG: FG-GAP-like repeat-containing protein [Bryobacteraceae bacterium]
MGSLLALLLALSAQDHEPPPFPAAPAHLKPALQLLRDGKTAEARGELTRLLAKDPADAEIYHQIARSHLLDFYRAADPAAARNALALAMESLDNTLRRDRNHIFAMRAKAVIHARAELLYYDPNLAYDLGARIARWQPSASEYLLNLAEWLSGEVRFTSESEHRVPHDPLTGIDRAIVLLDRVIDGAMPYSAEEALALFTMGKTLAKRGRFNESIEFFRRALARPMNSQQRAETAREMGVSFYRSGDFGQAAKSFYEAFQLRPTRVDQWLLKTALEGWKDQPPAMPEAARFPAADPPAGEPLFSFTDIAPRLGLDRKDGNGTSAWGDYDGDGRLDLLLAGSGTFVALYRNEGAKFREVTVETGLARVPSSYSLNFVDYDNDGRPDIYLTYNGWNGPMPNRLLRNTGGRFEDVSKKSGAADEGDGFVSLWGDLDNDGHLDIVIANGVLKDGSTPQVYRNNGDGTFTNRTREAGIVEPAHYGAIGAALGDYDRDGDLDIFFNGLGNAPNRLYRNEGGFRFIDVTAKAGVSQPPHNGFVAFLVDYNNDAWPDLLTTSLAPWDAVVEGLTKLFRVPDRGSLHPDAPRLYRNNRDGSFTDATWEARLHYPMGVMGAGVADLDNDGRMDLYFGTGDPQLSRLEPNRFFRNNGDGTFRDLTAQTGFARPGHKGHGVTFIDIDEDGDLDVYAQLGGHYPGDHVENAFYRNNWGNRGNWLQVDLVPARGNRHAIGTTLVLTSGDLVQHREVKGSEGFGATGPFRQHFGLGDRKTADSFEITWPGGGGQRLDGIAANRKITVRQP